jgi:hypothetical protein
MSEILRGHGEEIDLSELDMADLRCGIVLQLKEIERLRKRLADAALVEAELHSRIHANDTFLLTIAGSAFDREQLRNEAQLILGMK